MPHFRFRHIFAALMLMSLVSMVVLPAGLANRARGNVDGLFAPVALPVQRAAVWIRGMVGPLHTDAGAAAIVPESTQGPQQLRAEIERLRMTVQSLNSQVEYLARRSAEREALGPLKDYCAGFRVIGSDAGLRDSLIVQGSSLEKLRPGMPVLYREGYIAGRVASAGASGSQVRLITDPGFSVRCGFARLGKDSRTGALVLLPINTSARVVQGRGEGRMVITDFPLKDLKAANIAEGDWVVLNEPEEWPESLAGRPLGWIEKIVPQRKQPMFADVHVRPRDNLQQLRQVMVMVGK